MSKINNLKTIIDNDIAQSSEDYLILSNELEDALKSLASGKADGYLGLYSDHLQHGTDLLVLLMTRLFNCMLNHGFTPHNMNVGTIIPLVKNKRVGMSDSDNFRGICLQSSMCKLLDSIILKKEEKHLITSELQFGFKTGISSHMAASVVQETVNYYTNQGCTVYGLALDASKAFDRVEFLKLFECLISRNVNLLVVRFLLNMYLNQSVRVRFNQTHSDFFHVANGVKQGGVLSPILFSIYIDMLIQSLQNSGYGCRVGDMYVGCIAYADDILILTASLYSLKKMINICEQYAKEFQVKFNGNKSKLIIFQKKKNICNPCVSISSQNIEIVDEINYLGFKISSVNEGVCLSSLVNDFNIKVNSFLGDFNQVTSVLKNNLFPLYCTSYYGSHLCDIRNLEEMNVQWRKAIRRVWGLPYRAHSNLVYSICKLLPPEVIFLKRFVKFFYNGLKSDNNVISYLFRASITNNSRLGLNYRYILHKLNISLNDNLTDLDATPALLCNKIVENWNSNLREVDKRVGEHILELIKRRDSLDKWILNKNEIQEVIDMLSTD